MTTHRIVSTEGINLIYRNSDDVEFVQPLDDLTSAGTLIDPEDGYDLDLVSVQLPPTTESVASAIHAALVDRGDEASLSSARWLSENLEGNYMVETFVGRMLDNFTEGFQAEDC